MSFKDRDVISILDFNKDDLYKLFEVTDKILPYSKSKINLLPDKIMATAFFEPSTRTRLSFETAMRRLGGEVISIVGSEGISLMKGENLHDTVKMLEAYSNIIVIRHKNEGAAKYAAEIASVPIINGGDGRQHHPTQSMLDLYTIYKLKGKIDGLVYGILGDLKYARTANSLILALTKFKPKKIYLISPPLLRLRDDTKMVLKSSGISFEEVNEVNDILSELDILYVTRIQKERFPDIMEYEKVKGSYRITLNMLRENAKDDLKILHPLPKVDEIAHEVDYSKYAAYFLQASYGVPVRMALITLIFGVEDKI